ncbi:hypothetical protein CONLIGDRAFT_705680 [Coniochaeta ligniaria NRRL 30616]|uniref:Uncharacterized protein n=1 Tax=Coniochaeta ligniaria NRRL 30616 TaxID=1408157 RepID=A0A1J7J3A4_9PEZI|nr:hypothetical protein CONLIGDRAFT_705680 [Coniochaeta ligniaria NRRL 30616]
MEIHIRSVTSQLDRIEASLQDNKTNERDRRDDYTVRFDAIEKRLDAVESTQTPPTIVVEMRADLDKLKRDIYKLDTLEENVKKAEAMRQMIAKRIELIEALQQTDAQLAVYKASMFAPHKALILETKVYYCDAAHLRTSSRYVRLKPDIQTRRLRPEQSTASTGRRGTEEKEKKDKDGAGISTKAVGVHAVPNRSYRLQTSKNCALSYTQGEIRRCTININARAFRAAKGAE